MIVGVVVVVIAVVVGIVVVVVVGAVSWPTVIVTAEPAFAFAPACGCSASTIPSWPG